VGKDYIIKPSYLMKDSLKSNCIYLKNISFSYKNNLLFDNLNLTLNPGKITCLLGPSGVGKSSLLRLLARLVPASSEEHFTGTIHCDPYNVAYMAQNDLLLPWLSAFDNAVLITELNHFSGKEKKSLLKQANQLFERMGLMDCKHQLPKQLSGGMRQRVAFARTLLANKSMVVMDEPFSGLDAITRLEMQTLAAELLKNKTVLLVTHDLFEALRLGQEIYILTGKPAQLTYHLTLPSTIPRDLADPEVIHHQATLFHALACPKEAKQ
jgi:putative hydroxymethylpyrimidine transport system ATP-binding protein